MKARQWAAAALAVCMAAALSLPCFAAKDTAVIPDVRTDIAVHEDGTADVTHEIDLPVGAGEFELEFRGDWSTNGGDASAVAASGVACDVSTGTGASFYVTVDTDALTENARTLTLTYRYQSYDDLDPGRDTLVLPLFPFYREARVEHMTARVTLPASLETQDARLVSSMYTSRADEKTELDARLDETDGGLTAELLESMNEWENLALALDFAPGALGARPVRVNSGVRVTASTCDVTVTAERKYQVHQSVTVEIGEDPDSWRVYLPLLETSDSWDGASYEDFTFIESGGAEFEDGSYPSVTLRTSDDDDTPRTGTHTAEYTYTLVPHRFTEHESIYLPLASGVDSTENMTFTLTAPTLTSVDTFLNGIVAQSKYERFDMTTENGTFTLVSKGLVYNSDEYMNLTPVWDESAFSRSAPAAAVYGIAVGVLLLALGASAALRTRGARPAGTAGPVLPEGLTSAEAGYLCDGVVSAAELGTSVVSWAACGAARIEQTPNGDFLITRLAALPDTSPAWERAWFDALFAVGGGQSFYVSQLAGRIGPAKNNALASIRAVYARGEYALRDPATARRADAMLTASVLPAAVAAFAARMALGGAFGAVAAGAAAAILALPAAVFAAAAMRRRSFLSQSPSRRTARMLMGAAALVLTALPAAVIAFAGVPVWGAVVPALLGTVCAGVSGLIAKPAPALFERLCGLSGLASFLAAADAAGIEQLVRDDANAFYRLLPYAIATGLYEPWTLRFQNLYLPVNTSFANARTHEEAARLSARLVIAMRAALS